MKKVNNNNFTFFFKFIFMKKKGSEDDSLDSTSLSNEENENILIKRKYSAEIIPNEEKSKSPKKIKIEE